MLKIIIILIVASLHSYTFSSSLTTLSEKENKYSLTTESEITDSLILNRIDSLYNSRALQKFSGKKDIKIAFKVFLQDSLEKGAIVISSGRTESMVKYREIIYDLYHNGFSIYILDHRGQGFSGRMTKDPEMGYVENFQFYIDDLKTFYNSNVQKNSHKKIYLLGHSLGGTIGVTYIEQFPNDFNKAAFSSPMLGLPFPVKQVVSALINKDEIEYTLGSKGYKKSIKPFKKNSLTNSAVRYDNFMKSNKEYPETVIGGATYHWVYYSCKQFDIIFDTIEKIQIPVILFSGSQESIVSKSAHKKFVKESKKK